MPAQRKRNVRSYLDSGIGNMTIPTGPSCHVFVAYSPDPDSDEPQDRRPTKRARSTSASKDKEEHIPRPRNSYFLFRSMSSYVQQIREELGPAANQQDVVGRLGYIWHHLSEGAKSVWDKRAEIEKALHKLNYPNYKYNPQRRDKNDKNDKKGKGRQRSPRSNVLTPPPSPPSNTTAIASDDFQFSPSFLAGSGSVPVKDFTSTTSTTAPATTTAAATATATSATSATTATSAKSNAYPGNSKCIDPALLKPSPMNYAINVFHMQAMQQQQFYHAQDLGFLSPPLSSAASPSPSELSPSPSSSWDAINQSSMHNQMNNDTLPPGAPLLRSTALPNVPYGSHMVGPSNSNYGLFTPPPSGSFNNNVQLPVSSDDVLLYQRLAELNLQGRHPTVGGNYLGGNIYSNSLGLVNYTPGMNSYNGYPYRGHINATDIVNSIHDNTFVPIPEYSGPIFTLAGQNLQMDIIEPQPQLQSNSSNNFSPFNPAADNSEDTVTEMIQLAKEYGLIVDEDIPVSALPDDPLSVFDDRSWMDFFNASSGSGSSTGADGAGGAGGWGFSGQYLG